MKLRLENIPVCDHTGMTRQSRTLSCAGADRELVLSGGSIVLLPGLADVHVHLREPGFSHKETIRTGTLAAARGGFTTVCAMPNLNPVPDSAAHLRPQLEKIETDACVRVLPYGAITVGEAGQQLADMEALNPDVAAFSDDGKGVQSDSVMRSAMETAKRLGKLIVAHCEDNSLLRGGYIHDGAYARAHGHRGICSESEWRQVERDLRLVKETGCGYHVCHVSAKETVALIRRAKAEGLDVSCETAPHYLLLDEGDLQEDARFKMNPPLREKADREALLEGIRDGTVDMLVTDHAPHTAEEKSRGLELAPMGIVGLETSFPLCYTYLVKSGLLTLPQLLALMQANPCRRFRIPVDMDADFTLFDLGKQYTVDPAEFRSMGRSTPFAGWQVYGRCLVTVSRGKLSWMEDNL